jgi:hypothetical protein
MERQSTRTRQVRCRVLQNIMGYFKTRFEDMFESFQKGRATFIPSKLLGDNVITK